jgi:hypothetical protein
VFTYGPLGFLAQPLIVSALTGGAGFAYALVAQVVLAAVVLAASSRIYGWLGGTLLTFLALGLPLLLSDVLAYLAFFAAVWLLERENAPRARWLLPLFGATAAFELLVKLNVGILCLVLFALVAWRLPPRGVRAELVLAASFALSVFLLWLATGNPPAALPGWLRDSRHFVSGYTDAVATDSSGRRSALVYAALLLVAAAALLALQTRPRRPRQVRSRVDTRREQHGRGDKDVEHHGERSQAATTCSRAGPRLPPPTRRRRCLRQRRNRCRKKAAGDALDSTVC